MGVESDVAGGRLFPRLHWSAVIAGVCLAIAAHIVMGLVGAALGFAAEPADSTALGTAAAIWALITPFVATLLGAWLACRMAVADDSRAAYLHGILVWCVGLILGAVFLTGTIASGALSASTVARGNLGPAARMLRGEAATPSRTAEARQEDAARAAAAGLSAAALGSLAGLLGAVVGSGISRRRTEGKRRGWRIAIQRAEEHRVGPAAGERGYGATYAPPPPPARAPGATPGSPEAGPPPTDPYHH